MLGSPRHSFLLLLTIAAALASAPALAYIGPGAGAGFIGSLLTTLSVIVVSLLAILVWPIRLIIKRWRKRKAAAAAPVAQAGRE